MKTWKLETKRMGVSVAEPVIADIRNNLPLNVEADIALLDPPCTSTGEFGRQPSSKWRLTSKSAETMAEIQWQIINKCAECVKPGGFLVYTTASVMAEENEMIVERFLKWHPEFSLKEIDIRLGCPGIRGLTKCRRLYPHLHECNGTFVANLKKG
jgi:16S rRNA (cytosine967-C5)-methyltransferase